MKTVSNLTAMVVLSVILATISFASAQTSVLGYVYNPLYLRHHIIDIKSRGLTVDYPPDELDFKHIMTGIRVINNAHDKMPFKVRFSGGIISIVPKRPNTGIDVTVEYYGVLDETK
ncbi:uncharacterized protein LOC106089104 [Stomoxys calcitrans]|uniref:uncharacterized protein LOC106089104 n=1 Tax=Stomoxys calcitrans TaxID=35570 RepID=UPI0027E225EB|nr:uncharacterized protein LOC106089104 [Stomoxys calcitrans]